VYNIDVKNQDTYSPNGLHDEGANTEIKIPEAKTVPKKVALTAI